MKKNLELFIVVSFFFLLVYFLLYTFLFNSMCPNFKNNNTIDSFKILQEISDCKDSLVCEISNIETNNKNIISNWSCKKKINKLFEFDFYKDYIISTYNNILKTLNLN